MPKEFFYLLSLIAGLGVTVQAGMNSQLNLVTNNAIITALISFLVGTIALTVFVLITSPGSFAHPGLLFKGQLWQYTGGLLGRFL